jgi:hypothetical protein
MYDHAQYFSGNGYEDHAKRMLEAAKIIDNLLEKSRTVVAHRLVVNPQIAHGQGYEGHWFSGDLSEVQKKLMSASKIYTVEIAYANPLA